MSKMFSVLIPNAQWPALRQRAQLPDFDVAMNQLRQDVEAFMAQSLAVPDAPGGHYHHYFCPEHGVELTFDPAAPTEHRCPVDDAIIRGDLFDASWRWFVNNRLSQGALQLAVLWQLEGNPTHAERVIEILTGYAARYAGYEEMSHSVGMTYPNPKPGIATHQTLDESVWILPLTWAFDLVRGHMSPEAAETIAQKLLIPVAEFLVENHFGGIHNFACWHNAAIVTIGLVAERADLVEFANDGEFGLETQLREGVLSDGLWFEGSFSYHFYTLAALIMHLKATASIPGLDLHQNPTVRAMFDAPVQSAYPDGSLPATNDCWYFTGLIHDCCHGVPRAPAFYEMAYAWYGDPRFAQVLHRAYQQGPRDSLDALLYGPEQISTTEIEPLSSVHLAGSGYAILRTTPSSESTAEDQSYILLKHGPHGGGHGHPDKLNLILYAQGERLSADLGTPGYGLELFQGWYRQTVSHNTMTIDGRSQPEAIGQINRFSIDGPFQVADASVAWREGDYAGVEMRRVLLARPDYFLDICTVTCDRPRQIDWSYHNLGEPVTSLALSPAEHEGNEIDGYQYLSNNQMAKTDEDVTFTWRLSDAQLTLFTAGASEAEIVTASSPGYPPTELRSTLINRRQVQKTTYFSVFHPHGHSPYVQSVRWIERQLLESGWANCVVNCTEGPEQWLIRLSPDIDALPWPDPQDTNLLFKYCLMPGTMH